MRLLRVLVLVGIVWAGAGISSARASDPEFDLEVGRAVAWWGAGALPVCGEPSGLIVDDGVMADLAQRSGVAAGAIRTQCRIFFARGQWLLQTHDERCRTLFHEVGHLFGFGHSNGWIMQDPLYTGSFAVCDDFVRVQWPRRRRLR